MHGITIVYEVPGSGITQLYASEMASLDMLTVSSHRAHLIFLLTSMLWLFVHQENIMVPLDLIQSQRHVLHLIVGPLCLLLVNQGRYILLGITLSLLLVPLQWLDSSCPPFVLLVTTH
jgi:hypothetical protein